MHESVAWTEGSGHGGLAQLARASALHAEGQRFESVILHEKSTLTSRENKRHV